MSSAEVVEIEFTTFSFRPALKIQAPSLKALEKYQPRGYYEHIIVVTPDSCPKSEEEAIKALCEERRYVYQSIGSVPSSVETPPSEAPPNPSHKEEEKEEETEPINVDEYLA